MILLGTQNTGKLLELRAILGPRFPLIDLNDLRTPPPLVREDGRTYQENALKKAYAYQRHSGLPVIADDSGLEVGVLQGRPGVDSADYGGAALTWPQRWAHLCRELEPFPEQEWTALFRCVLCFFDGVSEPVYFEGVAPGRVLKAPRGEHGFGYDPIVFSDELGMSFAEAPAQAKNRISHRAKALFLLRDWLEKKRG